MHTDVVILSIIQMFGLLGIGWWVRRKYVGEEELSKLARVVVDVFYPLLIFSTVVPDLQPARLAELWMLPVVGFGLMALGFLIGVPLAKGLKNKDPDTRKAFLHICAVNNFGFLPIFILKTLADSGAVGSEAPALFFLLHLGSVFGFWTVGIASLTSGGMKSTLRKVLSPAMIALVASILLAVFGAANWMPAVVLGITKAGGSITVPLMLVIIGGTMQGCWHRKEARDVAYLTVARNVVIPAASIALLALLPIEGEALTISIIVALMPAAATAAMMTRLYGGATDFAAASTLATTVLSLATVPLGLYLAMRYFGY